MVVEGTVTHATAQGPRAYQEDRFFSGRVPRSDSQRWLMAVMDGHGGAHVANICSERIGSLFRVSFKETEKNEDVLQTLVSKLDQATRNFTSGSTLSVAYILEDRDQVVVAVLGDSHVLVVDREGKIHASPEHNVRTNLEERRRAEARGGFYAAGYIHSQDGEYGLQLSRSLGDRHLGGVLSREPEIYTVQRPEFVLVASDGLLDPSHRDIRALVAEVTKRLSEGASSSDLLKWAEKRPLEDNATAVLWRRDHP